MTESHESETGKDDHDAKIVDRPRADETKSGEVRVSTIIGDRLCTKCGFNLTGQPVMKEPRYELFIARCPECGAVASLQEYPILGKWANRWASLAAALWLFILLGGSFAFAMIMFGTSIGSVEVGSNEFADVIATQAAPDDPTGGYGRVVIDTAWWHTQNPWEILSNAGGFRRVVAAPAAGFWFGLFIAGLCFGILGSVALLHARRLRAAFVMLLPIAIAVIFQIITHYARAQSLNTNMTSTSYEAAIVTLGPILYPIADASGYIGMLAGLMIGRPLARTLVRAMLPPRLRSSLSFLWLTDGKEPPTAAR